MFLNVKYASFRNDLNHPDLPKDTVTGKATSSAGNWFQNGLGHGTHVAGTIAAIGNNGIGVTGVV
jgi:serine protease